jgi:hypothetical protein
MTAADRRSTTAEDLRDQLAVVKCALALHIPNLSMCTRGGPIPARCGIGSTSTEAKS